MKSQERNSSNEKLAEIITFQKVQTHKKENSTEPVENELEEKSAPVLIEPEEIFDNQIYTVKEAALLLKCCEKTVYRLLARGDVRHKRVGRGIRILGSELIGFMKGGRNAD